MSSLLTGNRASLSHLTGGDWKPRKAIAKLKETERSTQVWMVAGVVALGLSVWALYTFGPELRRYIKIKSM